MFEAGALNIFDVGFDCFVVEQLALFVLEGRVADFAGAAAHKGDGFVAGFLEPVQHHDAGQIADMEAFGGRVEADIGGLHALGQFFIQSREIAALVNEAALV